MLVFGRNTAMVVADLLCSVVLQLSLNIVLQNWTAKIAKQIVLKGITIKTYHGYYGKPILFLLQWTVIRKHIFSHFYIGYYSRSKLTLTVKISRENIYLYIYKNIVVVKVQWSK